MKKRVASLLRTVSTVVAGLSIAVLVITLTALAAKPAHAFVIDCGPPVFTPQGLFAGCQNPQRCWSWQTCQGYAWVDPNTGITWYQCKCV